MTYLLLFGGWGGEVLVYMYVCVGFSLIWGFQTAF